MRKTITTSLLATGLVLATLPAFAQGGSPAASGTTPAPAVTAPTQQHQTQARFARGCLAKSLHHHVHAVERFPGAQREHHKVILPTQPPTQFAGFAG